MKKILILMLVIVMSFTSVLFVSCGNTASGGTEQQQTEDENNPGGSGQTESDKETDKGTDTDKDTNPDKDTGDKGEGEETVKEQMYITAPQGETFLYSDDAKNYLLAGSGADVASYAKYGISAYKPVYVKWKNTYKNVENFTVECSINADYSDSMKSTVDKRLSKAGFDNLYKGTKYYVRLTANLESGEKKMAESTFTTSEIGPRPLKIDGIHNVRDIGGYKTDSGKVTRQGVIYRGGSLSPSPDFDSHNLTESGKKYMSEVLKIKLDMDLREPAEGGNLAQSPIPNANMYCFGINGYASALGQQRFKDKYKVVFQALAEPSNYPIYMHCSAGADRTGTVSFILNALLGVSEEDIIHDYEFTSFSIYGVRSVIGDGIGEEYRQFRAKFDALSGNTLKEKAENYLLSIGITSAEIASIRTIMGV